MVIVKDLRIEDALKGYDFTKIDAPKFVDKKRSPGLAVGGRFASLEELKLECQDYDVYIQKIQEVKFDDGIKGYWAVYACREKTYNGGIAIYRR
jgi:hypothetical protein